MTIDPDHSAIWLFQESLNLSHAFLNFGTSMGDGKSFTFQAYKWPTCHVELAGDTYNILTKVVFEIQANSKQTWSATS